MDSKFYVSLDAARLLKEKWYNEKVEKAYATMNNGTTIKVLQVVHNNKELPELCYSCPTKAEAIDWLESKGIIVELSYDDQAHMDNARWNYSIYTHDNDGWVEAEVYSWYENDFYPTRLEAEEAAIIKACELL